jgi:hypothetical protein
MLSLSTTEDGAWASGSPSAGRFILKDDSWKILHKFFRLAPGTEARLKELYS